MGSNAAQHNIGQLPLYRPGSQGMSGGALYGRVMVGVQGLAVPHE
jgi:hypothetical protein